MTTKSAITSSYACLLQFINYSDARLGFPRDDLLCFHEPMPGELLDLLKPECLVKIVLISRTKLTKNF